MSSADLETLMNLMRTMIEAENTVSEFYRACSEKFSESEQFWLDLANEESTHADMLSIIANTVKRRPEEFQMGKSMPRAAVKSFINRVSDALAKLRAGHMSEDGAISVAFHIESTFIEQKYTEAISTQNEKYLATLEKLQAAEEQHKLRIAHRMKSHKTYGR